MAHAHIPCALAATCLSHFIDFAPVMSCSVTFSLNGKRIQMEHTFDKHSPGCYVMDQYQLASIAMKLQGMKSCAEPTCDKYARERGVEV